MAGALVLTLTVAAFAVQQLRSSRPRALASSLELDPNSVAVMYFDDRSGGRLGYLADALTEALIDRLHDVRSLHVISANGVGQFRGDDISPDSIARALRTGTLVRGSIEPARGDSVRVVVRLVEGASGVDFKSTTLTGSARDPLQLREDIAQRAAEFLRVRLGEEIRLEEQRRETRNADAWSLVQQGEYAWKEAEHLAELDSIGLSDERFVRADSMLADAERLDDRWPEPPIQRGFLASRRARLAPDRIQAGRFITSGLVHAERALALESRNASALELRGTLRYLRWLLSLEPDPARAAQLLRDAESDLTAAVSISPSDAAAWSALSHLRYQKPDFTEAKLAALRAYQEDAYLSAAPEIVWRLYTTSYDLEDFPGATQWCAEGGRRFPSNARFTECQLWLMTARGAAVDIDRAWKLADSLRRITPAEQWTSYEPAVRIIVAAAIARGAVTDPSRRATLADSARRVLQTTVVARDVDPAGELVGTQAFVFTLLGDKDQAFRLLKEYFAINPSHRALFAKGNSWWWRPLMDDPRFGELVGYQQH